MEPKISKTTFKILYFISFSHLVNDFLQGIIPAVYPLLKQNYELSFLQVGFITFAYQFSASVLQPLIGYYTDKSPKIHSQIYGLVFSTVGVVLLAYANGFSLIIASCILIGIGSAIFHPESSRIANLASGGKIGVAQSIFQIGGNLGSAIAPLMVALIVLPYSQKLIIVLILPSFIGFIFLKKISHWYKQHILSNQSKRLILTNAVNNFPKRKIQLVLGVLLTIIFSKFIYAASLSTYYSFYLIEKFNLTIQQAQIHMSIYLFSYVIGTLIGGPLGDKFGRIYIIWFSVLGAAPFCLMLPYANLFYTDVLIIIIGLIMSSAFPAIISYAQELVPHKLGMISGLFYGFAFGIAAIGSTLLGVLADETSIYFVYQLCSFLPILGIGCFFLPNLNENYKFKKLTYKPV
ncbi:MFS transporter [Lutibacter flavus]|uniref:MFS transporter, FSR family, fosmidomycin resistance protein n=1 Tax=Lutibacter flavus TaxID=691689 RepID=A0A238ZL34_9FLAO|nr:MFS transporter [Lutibacter flavus]SNR83383.1 MFS transporter, FSR family, fosmidomycin resistance protein [Lutibacter flavus]